MVETITIIHKYLFTGVAALFLFQSLILFVRSKNNTARKTMAFIELLWGLVYTVTVILMSTVFTSDEYTLFREKVLITGSYYIALTHFFPIQVLVPGWLNFKRAFLLLFPNIILTVMYYGIISILGESIESLFSYAIIWKSIGHFNVWFRFVILFVNLIYIVWILKWLYGYEKKYILWKNNNFSDQEYVDISWMRSYNYILVGIFLFYLGILIFGGRIPVILHCTFVIISFSFLFYKSLFYENPYPEDFFEKENEPYDDSKNTEDTLLSAGFTDIQNDNSFESNIPVYTASLKEWMEKEKPYLYHDFKLIDISRILPLNRSYLSRVVNEGFGLNFNEMVRIYRVNYSKVLINNNPSLPIYKIADMCGFSSDTTFIKAFKQIAGVTPNQYRSQHKSPDK